MSKPLEKLTISNFQTHAHREIVFDPQITTIVGDSDVGKSSIIRALRWLAVNKPSGNGFIRHGEERVVVCLHVDGHTIKRIKGKSNLYNLDGKRFAAFGADVPEKIIRILHLSELNFQSQHDSPYWFSLSAGEVSRQLNQIVDLSVMDRTMANLARHIKRLRTEQEVVRERLAVAKTDRHDLQDVMKQDEELSKLEAMEQRQETRLKKRLALEELLAETQDNRAQYKRSSQELECLSSLIQQAEAVQSIQEQADSLEKLLKATRKAKLLAETKAPPASAVEKLFELHRTYREARRNRKQLEELVSQIQENKEQACRANTEFQEQQSRLSQELGTRCPLCLQPIASSRSSARTFT